MYMIDDYQLIKAGDSLYLGNYGIGAKISNQKLATILENIKKQAKLEISEQQLTVLSESHHINVEQLKDVLINKLNILQPRSTRKFGKIYISSDDDIITEFTNDSLSKEYDVQIVNPDFNQYENKSLVLYYRNNYSHGDFKTLYQDLPENVYLITAGIIHKILIIDNLYFKGSGLPSHFSNLNNLLACVHNDISITKNNWLLYYRQIMKENVDQFPNPEVTQCQRGYIAYCLQKFASQFTNFWKLPTTLDEINWFWNVDLTSFSVNREVAIHSPYSEYDMNLDFSKTKELELK
jgi:McbB family protein